MATTAKKTTQKKTTQKETAEDNTMQIEAVEEKVVKTFKDTDLIPCRSITQGELLFDAKKSGELYIWSAFGDVTEVEYRDLLSLRGAKSKFLFDPLFIIEDEDVLADPKWSNVKEIYDKMYDEDVDAILDMPNNTFEKVFKTLPNGLQNAIKVTVTTRIEDGTFDSLTKIKIIDEVCGTDLKCLL